MFKILRENRLSRGTFTKLSNNLLRQMCVLLLLLLHVDSKIFNVLIKLIKIYTGNLYLA